MEKKLTSFNFSSMSAVGRGWLPAVELFPLKKSMSMVSRRWVAGGSPALGSYMETRLYVVSY